MTTITWIFVQFLPTVGFILALALLSYIIRERRAPASTLAWLMAIIFVPYLGVPFYLFFGNRKVKNKIDSKQMLPIYSPPNAKHEYSGDGLLAHPGYGVFPPTSKNSIQLLENGEDAFHTIIKLIENAKHTIFISTYILGNDKTGMAIINELSRKASQGVCVRLLLDDLGCVGISNFFLYPLQSAGGKVAFFMPMKHLPFRGRANLRIHRKIVIVDWQTALIGGMNLAFEYMGASPSDKRWKDLALLLKGPIAKQLVDIFRSDWWFAAREAIDRPPENLPLQTGDIEAQLIASGPDVEADSLREAILTGIFRAKKRVWMVTPYFIPDDMLVESLCMALHRGIDVRLIIPKRSNHLLADLARTGYLEQLTEAGATVYLYQPTMLHAKALLIDENVALVGSANIDFRSLLLNYEIALSIYSSQMIENLCNWMYTLMKESTILKIRENFVLGVFAGIGRLFAPLL